MTTEGINSSYELDNQDVVVKLGPELSDLKASFQDEKLLDNLDLKLDDIDAVRILSGGTERCVDTNGQEYWRSPGYSAVDSNGFSTGAVYRVMCGGIVFNKYKSFPIVIGSSYFSRVNASPCRVISEELKQLGVDEGRFIKNEDTYDTIGELVKFVEFAQENGWENISCITNSYHLERVEAILENLDWLSLPVERSELFKEGFKRIQEGSLRISLIDSEDVIRRYSEDLYNKYIPLEVNHPLLKERMVLEDKGITDILSGRYNRFDHTKGERVVLRKYDSLV